MRSVLYTAKRFRLFSILITLFFIISLLSVSTLSVALYTSFQTIQKDYKEFQEEPELKAQYLHRLLSEAGYTGFIHGFKNMVLRSDLSERERLREKLDTVFSAIAGYLRLPVSDAERQALKGLQDTFRQYNDRFELAIRQLESDDGIDPVELDARVRVDDSKAQAALKYLLMLQTDTYAAGKLKHEANLNQGLSYVTTLAIVLPALILSGIFIFYILYRLWNQFRQQSSEITSIITNTADGIITIDNSGRIVIYNPAAEHIFGYSAEEVTGQDVSMLLPSHDRLDHKRFVRESKLYESRVINKARDLYGLRKDGTQFPMELNVARMDSDGERQFVGVFRDISERKLAETNLLNAKQEAESASQAKSLFLSNMSHEIRTPMNGVIGMLELLNRTHLSDEQRYYLNTALSSADLQMAVLNDILDYSKLEVGKLDLEERSFCLTEAIEDTCSLMSPHAFSKHIELTCYCAPDLPNFVIGDQIRLRQICANLIGNALKFTEQGAVNVSCEKQNTDDKQLVSIEIKDSGIGIKPEALPTLFQAFHQADASTTRRFGGSGLGLMISKTLVELMGGTIEVQSELGVGTTFTVRIPFKSDPLKEGQPLFSSDLRGVRVLAVDDSTATLDILRRYFENWGAEVSTETEGTAVSEQVSTAQAEGKPFELILIDLEMPEISGLEVASFIKTITKPPKPKVILLCSENTPEWKLLKSANVHAWARKPLSRSGLLQAINKDIGYGASMQEQAPVYKNSHKEPQFNGKVLLVEDCMINQGVAIGMLSHLGLDIVVANDGREAVELFDQEPYSVIFMDVHMPEMDGLQATALIREHETSKGAKPTPIIAMTALAQNSDRELCLNAGMDDYISKPIRPAPLLKVVEKWLPLATETNPKQDKAARSGTGNPTDNAAEAELNLAELNFEALDYESVAMLHESIGRMPERYLKVLTDFIDAVPLALERITHALGKQEIEILTREAHTLGSNSAAVGALGISKLARHIEHIEDKPNATEEIRDCLSDIAKAWPQVKGEIEQVIRWKRERATQPAP